MYVSVIMKEATLALQPPLPAHPVHGGGAVVKRKKRTV